MYDLGMTTAKVPLELGYKLNYEPSAPRISKKDLLMFLAFLLLTEGGGAIIGIASAGQIATW